jgi:transcriptional regulator with GAF, ATPase, and Fis domain
LLDNYERRILEKALLKYNWKKADVARALNTSDPVIRYKMRRLKIKRPDSE